MPNRAQRRAAARQASKQIRVHPGLQIPEPGNPFPSLAQLDTNRANAEKSPAQAVPSQRIHTLARHNGAFQLLPTEDPNGFEALKQSLANEHQPITETEAILVNTMAESHWLANRAQILTGACFDPETGKIADEKMFSLYLRYQTTHTRAFHKALNDLLKLRAEIRKADVGLEAQNVANERHEMKKQTHYWDVLKKDAQACHQIAQNTIQHLDAVKQHPGFEAQFAADLASQGLRKGDFQTAVPVAA